MNEETQYVEVPMQDQQQFSNFATPLSPKSDKADILDKINPDLIVVVIRHKLMGEELINGEWKKIQALQERAITELGAWDITNLMLPASSQNISLSKLNDHEIRARTLEIIRTAQHMCIKNWKEYGINGRDQLEFVHQIVMTNTFITLKQPEGEDIRRLISGMIYEQRNVTDVDQSKKRGGNLAGLFRTK